MKRHVQFISVIGSLLEMTTRLLCLLTVSVGAGCSNQANLPAKPKEEKFVYVDDPAKCIREPLGKIREPACMDVVLPLHVSGVNTAVSGRIEQVQAKDMRYYLCFGDRIVDRFDISVTAFVTSRGQVWVGPEQEFYIETKSGVVGFKLESEDIFWCHSLINKRAGEEISLETALERLKQEVSLSNLEGAHQYTRTDPELICTRVTELHGIFYDFGVLPCTPRFLEIGGITVGMYTVRVDLKWQPTGDMIGSAWIDIKSRKLLKATVSSREVYRKNLLTDMRARLSIMQWYIKERPRDVGLVLLIIFLGVVLAAKIIHRHVRSAKMSSGKSGRGLPKEPSP